MAKVEKKSMDNFGDRMKMLERQETGRRFIPLLPIYARIDGKCFSKFTKGMERPYDVNMSRCMIETVKYLVEATNARVGYTQSDEISLLWYSDSYDSQVFFDGKIFKMTSILAAMATSAFMMEAMKVWPEKVMKARPVFDCRIFQLPTKNEAANAFLWREVDATKNAVSMAARSVFSHKELDGKSGKEMQEMMWAKAGINFNDYPAAFKRGTFVQRRTVIKELTPEVLARIPEGRRPTAPVERREIAEIEMPPFRKVVNRVDVLFDGAEPETAE